MYFSPARTRLLQEAVTSDLPHADAASLAVLQVDKDYLDNAQITNILRNPAIRDQALPLLNDKDLGAVITHLPSDAQMAVLKHSSRAAVMQGLAHASSMSDEVFDFFVRKAGKRALREFHRMACSRGARSNYTPEQSLRVWSENLTRFKELTGNIPTTWGTDQVREAFNLATGRLGTVQVRGLHSLSRLWAAAEVAEVVSDDVRQDWAAMIDPPYGGRLGPRSCYDEDVRPWSALSSQNAVHEYREFADLRPLIDLGEPITHNHLEVMLVNRWPVGTLARSPRLGDFLKLCTDEALGTLLSRDLAPADQLLSHATSLNDVLRGGGWGVEENSRRCTLTREGILSLAPTAAVSAAVTHRGDFSVQDLLQTATESLGDDSTSWQFFWSEFPTWTGSFEELVDTAAAV